MRLLPLLLALVPILCFAQEGTDNAIHAVTVLHEDGTKTVTITDPEKHSSEASTYTGNDKLLQKVVYALDDDGLPASGIVYTPDNRPFFKTKYKHDSMNRLDEEDDYSMNDQLIRRFVYEFGPNGKVVRIRAYDGQGNELHQTDARKDQKQSLPRTH